MKAVERYFAFVVQKSDGCATLTRVLEVHHCPWRDLQAFEDLIRELGQAVTAAIGPLA